MPPQTAQSQFLTAIAADVDLWQVLDVRTIAVDVDGECRNLRTQAYLRSAPSSSIPRLAPLPPLANLRVLQSVENADRLPAFLDAIRHGKARVGDQMVTFRPAELHPSGKLGFELMSYRRFYIDDPGAHPAFKWSGHILYGNGEQSARAVGSDPNWWSAITDILRNTPETPPTFEALATYALGYDVRFGGGDIFTGVEIFAPLEARLEETTERSADEIHAAVVASSEAVARRVGLVVSIRPPLGGDTHTAADLPSELWTSVNDARTCRSTIRAGAIGETTLTLTVAGHVVERRVWPGGQGARSVALGTYEFFDPALAILRDWLHAEMPASRVRKNRQPSAIQKKFEFGVGRTLTLVGLSTDVLSGDDLFSAAVDVLGYHPPTGTCLAIECTIDHLDAGGKLGKLAARVNQLKECLPNTAVLGVIATAAHRSDIAARDRATALASGFSVLDAEAFDALLALADQGATASDALALIRGFTDPV